MGQKASPDDSCPSLTYGVQAPADFLAEKIQLEKEGVSYILRSSAGQIPIRLRLTGYFNVYNSLGAAALCFGQGVSLQQIKNGLEALPGVPGRFERIENDHSLNIVVDYAHTPNGLENVLQSARRWFHRVVLYSCLEQEEIGTKVSGLDGCHRRSTGGSGDSYV